MHWPKPTTIKKKHKYGGMRPIPGYNNLYWATRSGLVWSRISNKWMSPNVDTPGYHMIRLSGRGEIGNKRALHLVHRLILSAFKGESSLCINHKNGIKTDNRLGNLEYCTHSENMKHAYKTNLMKHGENNSKAKLTNDDVHMIRADGRTLKEIAKEFGISFQHVSDIKRGNRWRHLKNELQ